MSWRSVTVAMLCLCLVISGCTTTRSVAINPSSAVDNPRLAPGRQATIVLKNGDAVTVTVVSANTSGIVARSDDRTDPYPIAYAHMQSLQERRTSPLKTTAVVVGSVIVVLGIALAVYIDRVTGGE